MIIFKKAVALQSHLQKLMATNPLIGFVPTMGALHKGHISLIEKSKSVADKTVCSIFVNPTQFNDLRDFNNYPVTIEQDVYLLEKAGCDVLFLPSTDSIYPTRPFAIKSFALANLDSILEGKYRPGHFQGVCTVVEKLLQIVNPTWLFAGQKDYQQSLVLRRLLQLIHSGTSLIVCPTAREKDGLAMSSRNVRLNEEERNTAPALYQVLLYVKQQLKPGSTAYLKKMAIDVLHKKGFKPDYVEIAGSGDLQPVDNWDGAAPVVILAAAYLDNVRLIDNLIY